MNETNPLSMTERVKRYNQQIGHPSTKGSPKTKHESPRTKQSTKVKKELPKKKEGSSIQSRGRSVSWDSWDGSSDKTKKMLEAISQEKKGSLVSKDQTPRILRRSLSVGTLEEDMRNFSAFQKKYPAHTHIPSVRAGSKVYYLNPVQGDPYRDLMRKHRQKRSGITSSKDYTKKSFEESCEQFWTKRIAEVKTRGSLLEIFYQNIVLPFLKSLQTTLEPELTRLTPRPKEDEVKSKPKQKEKEKMKRVKSKQEDENDTSLIKHLRSFVSPFDQRMAPGEEMKLIANKLQLLKTIIKQTEYKTLKHEGYEYNKPNKLHKKILKSIHHHLSNINFKTLENWGIAGNFHWKKSRKESLFYLPYTDIKRSLIPDTGSKILKTITLNDKSIVTNGDVASIETVFSKLISALNEIHPLKTLLNLEQQVALFLFFVSPSTEPYEKAMQCLTGSQVDWIEFQKVLAKTCGSQFSLQELQDAYALLFDCNFVNLFDMNKQEYEDAAEVLNLDAFLKEIGCSVDSKKKTEYKAFKESHSKKYHPFNWEYFQTLVSPIPYQHNAYLDLFRELTQEKNRYTNYLINMLLQAMIPCFDILQLCSMEMDGDLDTQIRKILEDLEKKSLSLKGTILTLSKEIAIKKKDKKDDAFFVSMTKHYNICAEKDRDCVYAHLEMACEIRDKPDDSNLKWTVESKLFITPKAVEDGVVPAILSCFQRPVSKRLDRVSKIKPLHVVFQS